MDQALKRFITDFSFVLLNLAMTIMSCFLLYNQNTLFRVCAVLCFLLLCISIPAVSDRYKTAYRLFLTASIFLSLIFIAYIIMEKTGFLYYLKDFDKIKEFILSTKQWGVIVFIAITVFEVVVLPVPAAVTILIGVAIYGPFWAFVLSTVGTYIGSIIAFFIGRTFGKRIVSWLCGKEKTDKYARLLSDKGRGVFVIMLLFPFFPDDILCMVAGISNMSKRFFLLAMMLTRPIMIALTAFLGSGKIIPFKGWGIPVWIALVALTVLIFLATTLIKRKIDQKKAIKSNEKKEQ